MDQLNLKTILFEEMKKQEEVAFVAACDELKALSTTLEEHSDRDAELKELCKQSNTVLSTLCEASKASNFDRKFAASILRTTVKLLKSHGQDATQPATSDDYEQYKIYIDLIKKGELSVFKEVEHAMNMTADIMAARVEKQEEETFVAACNELAMFNRRLEVYSEKIVKLKGLYEHSKNILSTLKKAKEDNGFDRKLATSILRTTARLLKGNEQDVTQPASPEDYAQYKTYIDLIEKGKPSAFKKIVGAMSMFLGALLIAGSVAAKVLSAGLSTPVSNVTLGGGIALFAAGLALFKSGMRKSLSKDLYRVNQLSQRPEIRKKLQANLRGKSFSHSIFGIRPTIILSSSTVRPQTGESKESNVAAFNNRKTLTSTVA